MKSCVEFALMNALAVFWAGKAKELRIIVVMPSAEAVEK
jgi:hypothetical protein